MHRDYYTRNLFFLFTVCEISKMKSIKRYNGNLILFDTIGIYKHSMTSHILVYKVYFFVVLLIIKVKF